jgi:hypothetical protein
MAAGLLKKSALLVTYGGFREYTPDRERLGSVLGGVFRSSFDHTI